LTVNKTVTRFAPSPSGRLHLGHAYAALFAAAAAEPGGRFLLRIEDLDQGRARPEFEDAIFEDLTWLGLSWPEPVLRQSERGAAYAEALAGLREARLIYPCFCSRGDIRAEIARAGQAPHGPDGPLYPGLCRGLSTAERDERLAAGEAAAWRLDVARASRRAGPLSWHEQGRGQVTARPELLGDAVLMRKDGAAAYHLAVVVDDAAQGINLVTRGEDLFHATHLHRLLQALLQLPAPEWRHHRLILDAAGKRLAKRDDAHSLASLRAAGQTAARIRQDLGF